MRTFAQKPTAAQQLPARPAFSKDPFLGQRTHPRPAADLQGTTGDQVVQRRSEKDLREVPVATSGTHVPAFGHDFSRIAVHAPATAMKSMRDIPALPRSDGAEQVGGMPSSLQANLEALSGLDLSGIRVHRDSPRPARLNALAYAQGRDIYLGPGQDEHLAHEGWHVVQQSQGRVRPMARAAHVPINDDAGLEREADQMAARAERGASPARSEPLPATTAAGPANGVAQRKIQITGLDDAKRKRFLAKINEGSVLKFELDGTGFLKQQDPTKTSNEVYSKEMAAAIADAQTVILNLVSKDDANFIDSFATGKVDFDDMEPLPFNLFRSWLLHFVTERFALANYEANKATASAADFAAAHQKGHEAQERQMREWFPKKTIKYISEGFDQTTKQVDAAGNGSIDYVFDFTDVKHVFKQPIVAGATKENIISSKIIVVR